MNWFIVWVLPPLLAAGIAYLLWRIDEWQERKWRDAQTIERMARLLSSSEWFVLAMKQLTQAIKRATITLSELGEDNEPEAK